MNDNTLAAELIVKGTELLARHLPARAFAEFNRAIELGPTNSAAWIGRGTARLEHGDMDEAIADFTQAIELDPTDPAAWLARGDAHLENDDPNPAIADFTKGIDLDPRRLQLYDRRANAYLFKGEFENALLDYDAMNRAAPDDPLPYCRRADLHSMRNDLEQAIGEYDRAIGLAPRSEHYLERGRLCAKKSNYQAALADFAEAIRIKPNSPEVFDARSKLWAVLGDRGQANADYDEALRLGAIASGELQWKLGTAYEREGDRERAIVEFTRAIANYDAVLRIFPGDARLLYRRGLLKLKICDEVGSSNDIAAATAAGLDVFQNAAAPTNI